MPTLDDGSLAQIGSGAFAPAFFIWVDVSGDPIRVTTFGQDVTFAGTGDADLDGFTFTAVNPAVVDVSDVTNSDGGSDTLTVDLSGIQRVDGTLMSEIADKSLWQGRTVRMWMQVYDESGATKQGTVAAYYTGYASSVTILPSPSAQTIRLAVENYLAAFNHASNRSYLNQADYDPSDTSAQATLAAANMGHGSAVSGGASGGSGADSSGVNLDIPRFSPIGVGGFSGGNFQ